MTSNLKWLPSRVVTQIGIEDRTRSDEVKNALAEEIIKRQHVLADNAPDFGAWVFDLPDDEEF